MERKLRIFDMKVREPYFSQIDSGQKTIEGRKRSETWSEVKVGDYLKIVSDETDDPILMEVVAIREYDGSDPLFSYLTTEGLSQTLPGIFTLTEAIATYLQFWQPAEIKKLGLYAFKMKHI